MGRKLVILQGQRFSMLTVVRELDRKRLPSGQTNRAFLCMCDCGNETEVRLVHLSRGRVRSCGCERGENHGMSQSYLYTVWRGIKTRVSKYSIDKHRYFDRGIGMCDEWSKSFLCFKEWAENNGYKHGLQIDRKDNDNGYYPDNCRFTSAVDNQNNRSNNVIVDYHGRRIPFMILIREKHLLKHKASIKARINRGWSVEDAFDKPIRKGNYKDNH